MIKRRSSTLTTAAVAAPSTPTHAAATSTSPSSSSNSNSRKKHPYSKASSPSSLTSMSSHSHHTSRSPLPRHYQYQQQQQQQQRPEITSTARFRILGSNSNSNNNNSTGSSSPITPPPSNSSSINKLLFGSDYDAYYSEEQQPQQQPQEPQQEQKHDDTWNYALLIVLYTLQGIPMGLSASIPFLIQQKIQQLLSASSASAAAATVAAAASSSSATTAVAATASARTLYLNANAIFALCSWPFSLKLLWAPIVDACFFSKFGRRKSWLVPCQSVAGMLMVLGSNFVEKQLGFSSSLHHHSSSHSHHLLTTGESAAQQFHVQGLTLFFLVLYFLMATQDIAVDGWALTLLSPQNRGRGPVCNSIGQNIGYFGSFVGFLALNDVESSERWWRPLLGLPSNPRHGLVSLGGFLRFMGYLMLITTAAVAIFKTEERPLASSLVSTTTTTTIVPKKQLTSTESIMWNDNNNNINEKLQQQQKLLMPQEEDAELDASVIGLRETYHRLWAVCQLPAVRWLFWILFTYRLPTSLSDNVKFLKAVEYGLSKSTTALLSPTIILPLGILVPIVAAKIWHGQPLKQFLTAYKLRVTIVPLLDVLMLWVLKNKNKHQSGWWLIITLAIVVFSTAFQAIVQSLQFNSQMMFFAKKVDPAIGGSYMTLLNTAANLGGTWPASFVMWSLSRLSSNCNTSADQGASGASSSSSCRDPYFMVQAVFSVLGLLWIWALGGRVQQIAQLPDDAWRTHLLDNAKKDDDDDIESSSNYYSNSNETAASLQQQPYQYNYNAAYESAAASSSSFSAHSNSSARRNLSSVEVELGGTVNKDGDAAERHRQPRQHQQQLL